MREGIPIEVSDSITDDDCERALSALADVLEVLGWKILEPNTDKQVQGLLIGTPGFIDAWTELHNKRKDNLQ